MNHIKPYPQRDFLPQLYYGPVALAMSVVAAAILLFAVLIDSFLIFEYSAVMRSYLVNDVFDTIFIVHQTLVVIFLLAIYFSTKTTRAFTESARSVGCFLGGLVSQRSALRRFNECFHCAIYGVQFLPA